MKDRIGIPVMGFVILTIMLSVGLSFAEDPATANRENVFRSLRGLALRAQVYYNTCDYGSGCGSFSNLTLPQLTNRPTNAYGRYMLAAPSASSVTLMGDGIETGNNGSNPVEVVVVVYADSMIFVVNN